MQEFIEIKFFEKVVGIFRPCERTYIAHRDESHIFRMYNGLGLSYQIIKRLKDLRCSKIVILLHYNNGTTERLETFPDRFLDEGILWRDGEQDYQRILPLWKLRQKELIEVLH